MKKGLGYNIGKMLILFTIMLFIGTAQVSAAEGDKSGKCGDNVTWTYDVLTKTLTLDGSGATYDYETKDTPWIGFENKIEIIRIKEYITELGAGLFAGCTNLQNVIIPEAVTYIGRYAFASCTALETVQLPQNLKSLGVQIFQGCLALKQITGGGTVDGVLYAYFTDKDGFRYYSLECYPPSRNGNTFEIPEGVEGIGGFAFERQKNLKNIIIPQSVTRIYNSAIWKPQNAVNITFRGSIGKFAYMGSKSIITLPEGSTITVRAEEDKTALLNKLNESFTVNIANVPAIGLTLKDGSTHETVVMEPGDAYTPTVKLAPYDTTDQVTWSYESTDSVKSFDSYTGTIKLNGNGRAVLTGVTGSGLTVTSEVLFYLPCDRDSLKISYDYAPSSLNANDPDLAGTVLRIPLSGRVNNFVVNFETNYYVDMWMNTDPVNAEGWRYSYAAERMSLEASNPEIIQFDTDTGKITPKAVGTATVTAKADDGPNGYITRSFTVQVVERSVVDCQYYNAEGELYEIGKAWGLADKSQLVIKDGAYTLQKGIDYEVSYTDENPGQYVTAHIEGLGRYAGNRTMYCSYKKLYGDGSGNPDNGNGGNVSNEKEPEKPSVVGVKDSYTKSYGEKPFVLKAKGKGKLTYSTSNKKIATVGKTSGKVTLKEIGSATITIKSSDAARKVKVQVVPKKPSIQKASASGNKALKLSWRKDSKVTGYQVQVSTSSKFKGSKTDTVKKNKTTSYTVKKLKAKKKYYVQMRSYKTVSGKKYYSSWSGQKSVRTR